MPSDKPKTDIWVPIYIGDYLNATTHLTPLHHGAYFKLILFYWKHRGIKRCNDHCCRIVGAHTKAERQAVTDILDEFFIVSGSHYRHNRLDKELERWGEKKKVAVTKAKAAAAARWGTKA